MFLSLASLSLTAWNLRFLPWMIRPDRMFLYTVLGGMVFLTLRLEDGCDYFLHEIFEHAKLPDMC